MAILIDKEFHDLIPPLSSEEFQQLEENCMKEGIRDALVVWKKPDGEQVLVDGHNRYEISVKHNLPYKTTEMEFKDQDEAILWVIDNQCGRRNINPYNRGLLQLRRKEVLSKIAKNGQGRRTDLVRTGEKKLPITSNGIPTSVQHCTNVDSLQIMANAAGIGRRSMAKIQSIERNAPEEVKAKARSGEISINEAYHQTANIMRPMKKADPVKEAENAHRAFEEKKQTGVVHIMEASADKDNRRTLALDLSQRITKLSNEVQDIKLLGKDAKSIVSELTREERTDIQRIIRMTISDLTALSEQIGG